MPDRGAPVRNPRGGGAPWKGKALGHSSQGQGLGQPGESGSGKQAPGAGPLLAKGTKRWPEGHSPGLLFWGLRIQGEPQKSYPGEAGVGRKRNVVCAVWGLPSGAEGQELAGEAPLRQSVSNGHLAVTPELSLAFRAAVRRAPGPCLLITTN